jgi:hypothetical protein
MNRRAETVQEGEKSRGEKKRPKIQEIVVCSQEEEISEHQTAERAKIKSE